MYGNGVFLVKLPNGKPFRQVYAMEGLAAQMASRLGGKVIRVKWDDAPTEKAVAEEGASSGERGASRAKGKA